MSAKTSLVRWLRILCALIALAFGVLAFASGFVGSDPISFGGSGNQYYRIFAAHSPYFWLWGLLGFSAGAALLLFPWLRRHKEAL
ncbi:hypothetical protein [Thauera sp. SDU_THAU2]|uniref:hypothetical protein n=1 Tax=Thauera sp. SDU_THAU2 TaxID=3136633 RepID=UPI00311FB7C2